MQAGKDNVLMHTGKLALHLVWTNGNDISSEMSPLVPRSPTVVRSASLKVLWSRTTSSQLWQQQKYSTISLLWSHPPRKVELPQWNIRFNSLWCILIQSHGIFSSTVLSSWFRYPTTVGVNKNQTQWLYQKHKTSINFSNVTWYLTH